MPSLLLLTGPLAGRRFQIINEATLGRSPSCEISLQDGKVSRRHARLFVDQDVTRIEDLGSRNGTLVNGERISQPVTLAPGDKLQVGDTTALFDPPAKASISDREVEVLFSIPVEEVLPRVGSDATLYSLSVALLSATSEAMVLRRTAEELARGLNADKAGALLAETAGLMTASVVGAKAVDVPRGLARAALEGKEISASATELCAPLVPAGGAPLGLLYVERTEAFTAQDRALAAALGRIAGEGLAAVRLRVGRSSAEANFVGGSKPFRRALEDARRAAVTDDPVVLVGEAGSGRAALAAVIHGMSPRSLGPFVTVECRQEPQEVERELFGQMGTPGSPPRAAALLRADGGTLMLRNVQMLPKHLAERLAQAILRKAASPPQGGEEPVDVRVVASTGQPLAGLVSKEGFDETLAKALGGLEIELSPLRSRQSDVPILVEHFAARAAQVLKVTPFTLTPDARRLMGDYHWPGNVMELKLIAERLALLYPGQEVPALKLPPEIQLLGSSGKPLGLDALISNLERQAISEALREARGKKIKAAAILGISRPTLDKKIEDYGLVVEKVRGRRRAPDA